MSENKEVYYGVGSKDTGWDLGTSLNLISGDLKMDGANVKYHDGEGNEITKEQFNDLRIKKLDNEVRALESIVNRMQVESSDAKKKLDRVLELLEGKDSSAALNKEDFSKCLEEIIPSSLSDLQATLNRKA